MHTCASLRGTESCDIFAQFLKWHGAAWKEMETRRGRLLAACGRRVKREGGWEGYQDNFLSALIALTVCRLLPSRRSLIEITCT